MSLIAGLWLWNVRSTPSPCEILRTVNEEFRPRLLLAMTTPSNACARSRSPSVTLTCTTTVSPGLKSGILRVARAFSSSKMMLLAMSVTFAFSEKFIQEFRRIRRQATPRNQIRPAHPGARDRLLQPPALNVSVVPALQNFGHRPAFELHRPRVVRPVEQTLIERLFDRRALVPENPG